MQSEQPIRYDRSPKRVRVEIGGGQTFTLDGGLMMNMGQGA